MINESFTNENPDQENLTENGTKKRVSVKIETAKKSSKFFSFSRGVTEFFLRMMAVVKPDNELKTILFSVQGWEDGTLVNTSISWEDLSVNATVQSGFCCKKTTSKSCQSSVSRLNRHFSPKNNLAQFQWNH